ncbi:MAG: peptide deformylase [Xanthomarina sp.]|jgi:peptide deformylase|uniref:Peptide deformylase n=1 Tax=Xanthomarina gelatinilytica TaxID=1137281 RepID=M7N814_9FLAO|nr:MULTISPECIES: peptide deformylase [Xanthomarina]MCB0387788.1 peptide deformylase [Winogradskyella sp.]EMQ94608.1 Peptide deformylase [Xanthomarina gelatinilytica]MAL22858.1 peptide deformylase [Xanthomarina sp.]MBF61625.1 peptide deformylase [Xanthomarina sp.]MDX1316160.1 peptide deformylase [Xanthomarina gelatinilytica]|tara:strand:- start:177 stop:767 length:591 start_codon:yes stop_codon:yes gene_type:complete
MILPIVAYGDPVLKKLGEEINKDYPNLKELIDNMYETMDGAYGVGLAAPQIGLPIRLFIVDTSPFAEDEALSPEEQKELKAFKRTFINAQIINEEGDEWAFNEGCLSIPDVREDVFRKPTITITYVDENFEKHTETFTGLIARVIQHEYDHIEGILFTDKLSTLKKRLIKGKLANISKGKISVDYRMRFPNQKKKR